MKGSIVIGSTISHYKILEKLGEGGMGEVFLAHDTELERKVALKFLPPRVSKDREVLERFNREAKATAALQHPNIVTIHEIGAHEGRRFIAMAYIEGSLLSERIARGDLSIDHAIDITLMLSDALGEAHGAGIVHRDLKPDNIIVDKRNHPHVLDFGLAVQSGATRVTQEGTTVGTLHYMSPEQSRGDDVDERTDIFSLGAIFYEMITCQKAFPGDHSAGIQYKIANEDPQPCARFNNQVSPELERIVSTALAKDREVRYQTMSGVAAALKPFHASSGHVTAATGSYAPSSRGGRGKRAAFATAAIVAFVAAIGYGVIWPRLSADSSIVQIRTIAVLPFVNSSNDSEKEYFADGMTDALISDLGNVSALSILSRRSTMKYKNSQAPFGQIARELGADAFIEGSVLLTGERVRINVSLLLADGERLWGESYEGDLGNVLSLQSELARAITGQVQVNLAPLEEARLMRTTSVRPEAHKAYLKGHYYLGLISLEGLEKAEESFERAIALDPDFAPSYLGLATTDYWLSEFGGSTPQKAVELARKALSLDPDLASAYVLLAEIKIFRELDLAGAREEIDHAVRLSPNAPDVRQLSGDVLLVEGHLDEGLTEYRSALALSPMSHPIACALTGRYNVAGEFDRAIEFGTDVADNFPTCPFETLAVGEGYVYKGKYDKAIHFLELSMSIRKTTEAVSWLGCVYAMTGEPDKARGLITELESTEEPDHYAAARIRMSLGENDKAIDALEAAYKRRPNSMLWVGHEAIFDGIREEARFIELVEKVGLPSS